MPIRTFRASGRTSSRSTPSISKRATRNDYDAVVVGAGPAGAATALRLARTGASVGIVERARFPRTKPCGEYLSAGCVRALETLGVAPHVRSAALPLEGIRLFGPSARAELRFSAPAWSLPRATLDCVLLDAALAAGVSPIAGSAAGFVRDNSASLSFQVREPSGQTRRVFSRVLIGADGAGSGVARAFGLAVPHVRRRRFALGGHYVFPYKLDRYVNMFVDGRSYFAVNPLSQAEANVMLIVDERDLRERRADVDDFVRERAAQLTAGRMQFDEAERSGRRIAIGPLGSRARRLTASGVLLAGDAASMLDPFTGQGVYLALRSAQLASEATSSYLAGKVSWATASRAYESALHAELARRTRLCGAARVLTRNAVIAACAAALLDKRPNVFRPLFEAITGAAAC